MKPSKAPWWSNEQHLTTEDEGNVKVLTNSNLDCLRSGLGLPSARLRHATLVSGMASIRYIASGSVG